MRSSPRRRRRAIALLLLGAAASVAHAGSCSVSATSMAFGRYQPLSFAGKLLSTDRDSDATVSVVCSAIVTGGGYTITLGPSAAGNSIVPRYLAHDAGGPPMNFNIYTDATYTTVWGDGFTGRVLGGTIPVGDSNRSHTVFGRIPAGQNTLRAGSYSGTLTLTISFNP